MNAALYARLQDIAVQFSLTRRAALAKARAALARHDAETAALEAIERSEAMSAEDPAALRALAAFQNAAARRRRIRANERARLFEDALIAREAAALALGRERAIGILRKREEAKARAARERREERNLLPKR